MTQPLPMFPLNSVLFPGVSVPLRVFEERYRAMVHRLLGVADPADRLFGSVAIREGYEVGDHGAQSLYRVGCRLQLVEATELADGTFEVLAVGRDRMRLDRLESGGPYPTGHVTLLTDPPGPVDEAVVEQARAIFTAYRAALLPYRDDPLEGALPTDPELMSWVLSACAPLPMSDRQALLEADGAQERLQLVCELLKGELRAMNVIPSLPATEVARTRWSPN